MIKNKFYLDWHIAYDHHRKSDVFYCDGYRGHTPVVDINYMGKIVQISCDGEMDFEYKDFRVRNCDDLFDAGITSDLIWHKVIENYEISGNENTPWFDAYLLDESNNWEHLDMVNGDIDDIIHSVQKFMLEITR